MDGAKLVVVGGDTKYKEIELRFPAVVGRNKDCDIVLRHALVSRRHCEILSADSILTVRDLGSLNGTFVGRERITERQLQPGELLTIGTVTFRAVYGDWSEDDDVLAEVENISLDTANLASDKTKLAAGKDETKHVQDGSAAVIKTPKEVGA